VLLYCCPSGARVFVRKFSTVLGDVNNHNDLFNPLETLEPVLPIVRECLGVAQL